LVNYGLKLLVAFQVGLHHGDLIGGNVLGAVARAIPPLKVADRTFGGLTQNREGAAFHLLKRAELLKKVFFSAHTNRIYKSISIARKKERKSSSS